MPLNIISVSLTDLYSVDKLAIKLTSGLFWLPVSLDTPALRWLCVNPFLKSRTTLQSVLMRLITWLVPFPLCQLTSPHITSHHITVRPNCSFKQLFKHIPVAAGYWMTLLKVVLRQFYNDNLPTTLLSSSFYIQIYPRINIRALKS